MFCKNSTDLLQHKNFMSVRSDEAKFCKNLCLLSRFVSSLPFFCTLTKHLKAFLKFYFVRLREGDKQHVLRVVKSKMVLACYQYGWCYLTIQLLPTEWIMFMFCLILPPNLSIILCNLLLLHLLFFTKLLGTLLSLRLVPLCQNQLNFTKGFERKKK